MTLSNPAQYISGRTVQEQMNSLIDYVDTRAAEVATDAIASDVAQVHQDMLDADADASAAAASAAAAAGTLANAVKKTGEASQSIQGDVNVVGDFTARATRLNGATAINADLSVVGDLSVSNDATLSGTTSVLTQATGTYSSQAASGLKVKNELDNYAPMVRTTGNQSIAGEKLFTNTPVFAWNVDPNSTFYHEYVRLSGNAVDVPIATINGAQDEYSGDLSSVLQLNIYNKGDTGNYSRLFITHRPDGTLLQLRRYKNGSIVGTTTIAQIMDP